MRSQNGGTLKGSISRNVDLLVPDQIHVRGDFISVDLAPVRRATGVELRFVLGADVLSQLAFLVDGVNGRVVFAPSGRLNFNAKGLMILPLSDWTFPGVVSGHPVTMKIDTGGARDLTVFPPAWTEIFGDVPLTDLGQGVDASGAVVRDEGLRGISVQIASTSAQMDVEKGSDRDVPYDALLGFPFFKQKIALFDEPAGITKILDRVDKRPRP